MKTSTGSVLEQMTTLMLAVPSPSAPSGEVAAWYRSKAILLEHIAAEGGRDADFARGQASLASLHAARLLGAL